MYVHIHFVEEKELIDRFGDSYREYRNKTPAFFVPPKNWGLFFKYLIGMAYIVKIKLISSLFRGCDNYKYFE